MSFAMAHPAALAAPAGPVVDDDNLHACSYCKETFRNKHDLDEHKVRKLKHEFASGHKWLTHMYCEFCDTDIDTSTAFNHHWAQYHREKQDINCPGCSQHFVHFSAFVRHVELHECPVISTEDAAAACQKELDFAKALQERDFMGRGLVRLKDFSIFLGQSGDVPKHLSAGAVPVPQQLDFPRLPNAEFRYGGSKVPDLLTGDGDDHLDGNNGHWSSDQALFFPNAPPAQRPTYEQTMQLQRLQDREDEDREEKALTKARGVVKSDPRDPTGPDFHPESTYCKYTKTYKCPLCKAKKGFKTWPGLQQHLKSAAHAFTKVVTCPTCLDRFAHLFALAAHVESADKKCGLKHSDMFEIFLGQLTWNLIEAKGHNKFDISKKAKDQFGVTKPSQPRLQAPQPFPQPQQQLTYGGPRLQLTQGAVTRLDGDSSVERKTQSQSQTQQQQQPRGQSYAQPQASQASLGDFPPLPGTKRAEIQGPSGQPNNQTRVQQQPQQRPQTQQPLRSQQQPQQRPQAWQQPQSLQRPKTQQRPQSQQQTHKRPQAWQQPQQQPQVQPQPQSQLRQQAQQHTQQRQVQQQSQQRPEAAQYQQPQYGAQQQSRSQQQQASAKQPSQVLGSGLTAAALAQVPSYPKDDKAGDRDSVPSSGDGDAGW